MAKDKIDPNEKKLIPISEAAEILGVSIDTIRRWDKQGVLHSERPDGKTRHFSVEELEKVKFSKSLTISEASEQLGISPSTLRRLEDKGLIKPERDKNGERVYNHDSLEKFLHGEYFLRQKEVEEKILEPLKEPEDQEIKEDKTQKVETQHKILGSVLVENKEHLSELLTFKQIVFRAAMILVTIFVLLVSIITILFLLFPEDSAKFFGYKKKVPRRLLSASSSSPATNVLGAKYDPDIRTQGSVLGVSLRPFSNVSLGIVRAVNIEIYKKVAPQIKDVNDVFGIDEEGNLEPQFTLKPIDTSYIAIRDQGLITNLNADYIRGRVPGIDEGNLAIIGKNGTIQGVALPTRTVTSSATTTSSGDITEVVAGSGLTGGGTSGSVTLNIGAGSGISIGDSEVAIDASTSSTTTTTATNSGLEVSSDGLRLLGGCSSGQVLKWSTSSTKWECGTAGGTVSVEENDASTVATASTFDFLGADFAVSESPSGEANISIDYTNSKITRTDQSQTITGSWTFSTTPTFSALSTGILHSNSSGAITSSAVALGSSDVSGTLGVSNGGTNATTIGSAGSIAYSTGTAYAFSSAGTSGQCLTSAGTGTPTWGTCGGSSAWSALTDPTGNLSLTMGANTSLFTYNAATGTSNLFRLVDTTSNTGTGYIFSTETATSSNAKPFRVVARGSTVIDTTAAGGIALPSFTSNGGPLYTNGSGVLAQSTAGTSTQVLHGGTTPSFSAVSLTADVSGTLPIANGGTNSTATPTAGAVAYGTGSAFAFTAQGSSGQCLQSAGAGTPVWATCSTSSAWSSLTDPTGNLSLAMGANTSTFTYNAATGSNNLFKLIDTASNTGTGYILDVETATSSSAKPFRVVARGNTIIDTTSTGGVTIGDATAAQAVTIDAGTGTLNLGNGTGAKTINIGTGASGNTINIATNNAVADTINIGSALDTTTIGGAVTLSSLSTGVLHSNGSGVISSSAVNLAGGSSEVTGVLPLANGGTNKNVTASNSQVFYSDSDSFELTTSGSTGQCLQFNSGSAPTWGSCSGTTLWNSLGNPTGNLALTMGANTSTFTFNAATGTSNLFSFIDSASNTGTGYILDTETATSSNAKPFRAVARGNTIIDTTAAGGVVIGNSTAAQDVTIDAGSGTLNLGNSSSTKTINIGTGTAVDTIHIGDGGTGADLITIGSSANAWNISSGGNITTSGNFSQTGATTFSTGTGTISLNGDTTIAAGKNLTFTSGAGTFTQNYSTSSDATADVHAVNLSAAGTGSTGTLRGVVVNQADTATTGVFDSLVYIGNQKTPETTTNGILIEQNAASGTLTNALHISNTAGTLTSGIVLDGTAPSSKILDTASLDISGAGAVTGATALTSSGAITFSGLNTAGAVVYTDGSGILGVTAATGSTGLCLLSAGSGTPTWGSCITGSGTTLQTAYNSGNTITTPTSGSASDIAFTLSDSSGTDSNFTTTIAANSSSTVSISRADGGNTTFPSQLLLLQNADGDGTLAAALKVTSSGGTITNGIDLTGSNITNAINVGNSRIFGADGSLVFSSYFSLTDSGGGVGLMNFTGGDATVQSSAGKLTLQSGGSSDLVMKAFSGSIVVDTSRNVSGIGINQKYVSAATQTGAITGQTLDLSTNLTPLAGSNITGITIKTPALTATSATTYTGIDLTTIGALTSNGGNMTFHGINITNPNITQTANTNAANGVNLTLGTMTTGGTQTGINIVGTTPVACSGTCTLNAIKISLPQTTSNLTQTGINTDYTQTYTTAQTEAGNLLKLNRALTINTPATTLGVTGAVATITDNCTQSQGTCTSSADLLSLTQSYASNTGSAINITTVPIGGKGISLTTASGIRTVSAITVAENNTTGTVPTIQWDSAETRGGLLDANLTGTLGTENFIDLTASAAFTSNLVDINTTAASSGNIIDITTATTASSGNLIDLNFGNIADTGDAINISMGAAAVGAQGLVITTSAGIRTASAIQITENNTTGTVPTIQWDSAETRGGLLDVNLSGALITENLIDITTSAAFTSNLVDVNIGAQAATGDIFNLSMGSTALAAGAFVVVDAGGARTDALIDIASASTGDATDASALVQINSTGALSSGSNIFDINSSAGGASNAVDITYSGTAATGNAIDLNMGTNVAGDAVNIATAATTGQAIQIDASAYTTGAAVVDINGTSIVATSEDLIQGDHTATYTTAQTVSGNIIDLTRALTMNDGNGVSPTTLTITGALATLSDTCAVVGDDVCTHSANTLFLDQNVTQNTGSVISIDTESTGGNAINIATAQTTGNAINIDTEAIFTNELIDINLGAQAATGDVLNIAMGATAVAAQAIVIDSDAISSTAGWALQVDASAAFTGDVIDFDNTGNAAWTGNVIDIDTGIGDYTGNAIDIFLEASTANDGQAMVVVNDDESDQAGWLINTDAQAAFTSSMIQFDSTTNDAWTGNLIDIDTGTGNVSGNIIDVVLEATTNNDAQFIVLSNADDSDQAGWFADIDTSNTWSGNMFDIATGAQIWTGNMFDVNVGAAAATGDIFNLSMGSTAIATGAFVIADAGGARTDALVDITSASTGDGTDASALVQINSTGALLSGSNIFDINSSAAGASNAVDITYSTAANTGNAVDLNMGTNVAGDAISIATAATTGNAIDITSSGVFTNDLIDINIGAQLGTGDIIDIDMGSTAVAARALNLITTAGIRTSSAIDITESNTSGNAPTIKWTSSETRGGLLDINLNGALITENLIDIDTSGAFTSNIIDITTTTASSGHLIGLNFGNVSDTGDAINITMGAAATAAQGLVISTSAGARTQSAIQITENNTTGTVPTIQWDSAETAGGLLDVNLTGALASQNLVDITTSGIFTSNLLDVNIGAQVVTGDVINLSMGSTAIGAGAIVIPDAGGARTDALVDITSASTGDGNDASALAQINSTGALSSGSNILDLNISAGGASNTVDITYSGTANTGNAIDLNMGTNAAGDAVNISSAATTGQAIEIVSTAATTGNIVDISSSSTAATSSDLLQADHTATYTVATTVSGNIIDLTRALTMNDGNGASPTTLTVNSALITLSDNCVVVGDDVCTHSGNVLSLTQSFASSTGDALIITNAATNSLADAIELAGAGNRTINSTSANLTIETTTSGNIILDSASNVLDINDASIDLTTQATDIELIDANTSALTISQAALNYLAIDTSGEIVTVGRSTLEQIALTTDNDGATDVNITGGVTITSAGTHDSLTVTSSADTENAITVSANSLSTGTGLAISATGTSFNGELLTLSKTGASGSTAFQSDIANITYSQTFNANTTGDTTGNVLDISRAITVDDGGAGTSISEIVSGALLTVAESCAAGTLDTCTHSADTLFLDQNVTQNTGNVINIDTESIGGNAINIATAVTIGNAINIDAEAIFTNELIDINIGAQAATGDAINIDLGATAVGAQALVIANTASTRTASMIQVDDNNNTGTVATFDLNIASTRGGLFDIDTSGAFITENLIDITTGAQIWTSNIFDVNVGAAAATGDVFNIAMGSNLAGGAFVVESANGARTDALVDITSASTGSAADAAAIMQINSSGALNASANIFDINATGGPSSNAVDVTFSTTVASGNMIDLNFGANLHTGDAINIDLGATAVGAQGFVMTTSSGIRTASAIQITENNTTGTVPTIQWDSAETAGGFLDANLTGALAGQNFIDLTTSAAFTSNLLDVNIGAQAATGDVINISMGSTAIATGAFVIADAGGARTDALVDITSASTGDGTDASALVQINSTGALLSESNIFDINSSAAGASNAVDITYSTAANTGNAVDLNMGTNVAGDAVNIDTAATTGQAIQIDTSGVFTNSLIDINIGAQAATGDVVNIDLGSTALSTEAIVLTASGARTASLIDINENNTTGTVPTIQWDSAETAGGFLDANLTGALAGQNFIDLTTSAAFTSNLLDVNIGAQAATGDVINISLGSTALSSGAFVVADAGGARTDAVFEINSASTGDGTDAAAIFQINSSGALAASSNVLDLNASAITSGNILDISNTSAVATSSDVINTDHTATYTTAQTVSGNILDLARALTINDGNGASPTTLTVTGALTTISDDCSVVGDDVCTHSANMVFLDQNVTQNTGSVINIDTESTGGNAINIATAQTTGNAINIDTEAVFTNEVIDINIGAQAATGDVLNISLGSTAVGTQAIVIDSDGTSSISGGAGWALAIDASGAFTGDVIDFDNTGNAAWSGNIIDVDTGTGNYAGNVIDVFLEASTNNDGQVLTVVNDDESDQAGWLINADAQAAFTSSMIQFDSTTNDAWTGNLIDVDTGTGNVSGNVLDVNFEATANNDAQFLVLANADESDQVGWLADIDTSAAWTANMIDITTGAQIWTGNMFDVNVGAAAATGDVFNISMGSSAIDAGAFVIADAGGARTDAVIEINSASTGSASDNAAIMQINASGALNASANILDINVSAVAVSNTLDITYSAAATGNAIDLNMSSNIAGDAINIATAATTGQAIQIDASAYTTGAAVIDINGTSTAATTEDLIQGDHTATYTTAQTVSGNILDLSRALTMNDGNGASPSTLTVNSPAITIADNCAVVGDDVCTHSGNVLSLTQSYSSASGTGLAVSYAGTGNAMTVSDGTNVNTTLTKLGVLTLGLSSTTQGKLQFAGTGAGKDIFQSGSHASDITYTWPTTGPTATQFLQTNSSGQLAWALSTTTLDTIGSAAAVGNLANADFAQVWNWTLTTAAKSAFTFGETAAATNGAGSQFILDIKTLAASTATPLRISNVGTADAMKIQSANASGTNTNGLLIDQTGAGTVTNALQITNSAGNITNGVNIVDTAGGTLATGILMSGTFTNYVDTPNFDVSNAGNITVATSQGLDCNAGSCTLLIGQTNATTVTVGRSGGETINLTTNNNAATDLSITGGVTITSAGTHDSLTVTSSVDTENAETITANSLTTGTGLAISSTATSFNGELLTLSKTGASGSTSFTSDIGNVTYSQTFNATGTSNTGNVLDISRAITVDDGTATGITGTITAAGDVVTISDNCSTPNTGGGTDTCTHAANVLFLDQNYANASGAVLELENAGTGQGILLTSSSTGSLAQLDTTTTGTVTDGLLVRINNSGASAILTNAIDITNTDGDITNGILIVDTLNGTIADGIEMTGTYTNYINTTNFDVSNAGVITLQGAQTADITTQSNNNLTLAPGGTGAVVVNTTNTSATAFDVNVTGTAGGMTFNTSDGAIAITAAGATNGDITLTASDNMTLSATAAEGLLALTSDDLTIDAVDAISIDVTAADAASNISVAASADAEDLTIETTGSAGDLILNSADDIALDAITEGAYVQIIAGDNEATSIGAANDIELKAEDDTIVALTAAGQLVIDAATNVNSTATAGVVDMDVDLASSTASGIDLNFQSILTATGNVTGIKITPDQSGGTAAANTYTLNAIDIAAVAGVCPSTATCTIVDLDLTQGATISNATNNEIHFNENSNDLQVDFGVTTASTVTFTSDTTNEGIQIDTNGTGALTLNTGTTGTINIGNDTDAELINLGTGAGDKDVTIGSTTAGSTVIFQAENNLDNNFRFVGLDLENHAQLALCVDTEVNGNVEVGTSALNAASSACQAASSRRFKHDINTITQEEGLRVLRGLNPVTFIYNEDMPYGDGTHFGYIAEEVAEVRSDLVIYGDDGLPQALNYTQFAAINTAAIKAVDAKVSQIEQNPSVPQDIFVNTVHAGLEMTTPRLNANQIALDSLKPLSGKDIALNLTKDGNFIVKNEDGEEAIKFDGAGNAYFKGTITADKVKANQVEGLEVITDKISSISEKLAGLTPAPSATPSAIPSAGSPVQLSKIEFESGKVALDLEVLGNLKTAQGLIVEGSSEFRGNSIFRALVEFFSNVIFHGDVVIAGRPTFNSDTAGFAVIKQGADKVDIQFDREYENTPLINVSMTYDDTNDPALNADLEQAILATNTKYIVSRRTVRGFTIKLATPTAQDIRFSWVAIAVKDAKTFTGNPSSPVPTVEPTSAPISTPAPTESPTPAPTGGPTETPSPTPTTEPTPTP